MSHLWDGGSSFLNSNGEHYLLNDIDENIIALHEELGKYIGKEDKLLKRLYEIINHYGLSCSFKGNNVPDELKKEYVKTYYSKYNKEAYLNMRDDFNKNKDDMLVLYLLLIYGFNHMLRFNSKGDFNLPVGNVDFNKNVYTALIDYLNFREGKKIIFKKMDYKEFIANLKPKEKDFIFLDPPYLISTSEYNKFWNENEEKELYKILDELDRKNIRFGITNLVHHKGKENTILKEWAESYNVYDIKSNYISYFDNSIKKDSQEIFVTNIKKRS